MVKIDNIALIAPIEADLTNTNTIMGITPSGERRLYEQEAIRCFSSWRNNGGWLKDIPIYCLCFSKNHISEHTKNELAKLNVTYIEDECKDISKFTSGFISIPYTGYYFEKLNPIKEEITIKIDLDNELLRPFPKEWFDNIENSTIVGQYNELFDAKERKCFAANPFDTSLIITHKKNDFYSEYYRLCFANEVLTNCKWLDMKKINGEYWLEEFAIDYMYEYKLRNISPVQDYQTGYAYPPLTYFVKSHKIDKLFLKHSHLT